MNQYKRLVVGSLIGALTFVGTLTGCSEERKREAARIAAEMEAKERGETLPPEPIAFDSTVLTQRDSSVVDSGGSGASSQEVTNNASQVSQEPDGMDTSSTTAREPIPSNRLPVTQNPGSMPPLITDGWTVQVESSPSQLYIESQVQVFKDRGYEAYLGSVTKESKTFYRLRVGKFSERSEADRVSAEINSMYNLQSWVDRGSW